MPNKVEVLDHRGCSKGVVTLSGAHPDLYHNLGLACARVGQPAAAPESFLRVLELEPDNEDVKQVVAVLEQSLKCEARSPDP